MIARVRALAGLVGLASAAILAGCTGSEPPAQQAQPSASADYGTNMVRCLTAMGWDVRRTDDGGFDTPTGIPDAQQPKFETDTAACRDQFGYVEDQPITSEQASSFYDKQLKLADCLRGVGYSISDPPSREAYVEALVAGDPPPWAPGHEMFEATALAGDRAAYEKARKDCPPPTTW